MCVQCWKLKAPTSLERIEWILRGTNHRGFPFAPARFHPQPIFPLIATSNISILMGFSASRLEVCSAPCYRRTSQIFLTFSSAATSFWCIPIAKKELHNFCKVSLEYSHYTRELIQVSKNGMSFGYCSSFHLQEFQKCRLPPQILADSLPTSGPGI